MYINSDQLLAFFSVTKCQSFSKASRELALSQPALSLRIKKLEESLRTSLFLRESSGIKLTEAGERLLLHCKMRGDLEKEFLGELGVRDTSMNSASGLIRIAGFSTIVKSVLMPSLHELVIKFPELQVEVFSREMYELKNILKRSEADFVVTEGPLNAGNIESILIGYENNVLVESKTIKSEKQNIYFDNDAEDQATYNFFKAQTKKTPKFRRQFLDEVYTIIDAVERGWGRAVLPRHLIRNHSKLRIISDYKPVKAEVYLSHYKQAYYSKLHHIIENQIVKEVGERLALTQK